MHRILILDSNEPLREKLTDVLQRTGNVEVAIVADAEELVSKVRFGPYAAVFADRELIGDHVLRLVDAVKVSVLRPMLVLASNDKAEDLDPDVVTLVVRTPYDVLTVAGVLISAVIQVPADQLGKPDSHTSN